MEAPYVVAVGVAVEEMERPAAVAVTGQGRGILCCTARAPGDSSRGRTGLPCTVRAVCVCVLCVLRVRDVHKHCACGSMF